MIKKNIFLLLFLIPIFGFSQIKINLGGSDPDIVNTLVTNPMINCSSVVSESHTEKIQIGGIAMSNGVLVHNSVGVEGVVFQPSETKESVSLGIETWTLDICLQFFEHVKSKLALAPTQDEALKYELKLKQIEESILVLKSQK